MTEIVSTAERDSIFFKDFPFEGIGKRYMSCNMYDECLHKAAVNDWQSFNCEGCVYEERQVPGFPDPVFVPDEDLQLLIFEGDSEPEEDFTDLVFYSLSFFGETGEDNEPADLLPEF